LQEFLKSHELNSTRINYSFTSNQELALALVNGKIRHAVLSEPLASQLLPGSSNLRILTAITVEDKNNKDQNDIFVQTSLVVNKKFADKNPETIRQLAIAYNESCMFTTQFPDSAASLLYKYGFFAENKLDASAVLRCNIQYRKASEVVNQINQYLQIFHNFDPEVLGGKLPDTGFVYHY
jgi:NitT/TauT family transport system substrate-binding protein